MEMVANIINERIEHTVHSCGKEKAVIIIIGGINHINSIRSKPNQAHKIPYKTCEIFDT